MDTNQNLNDCTRVLVSNLHEKVNESYLFQCLSNNVDPPRCKTELLPDPTKAIVDLGSFAKTQEAVCKMNGEEAYGKRMSVSLYLESFVPSSEKKVQLSQFPTYWRYSNFYDLLQIQNLGTIVGIELLHDPDDENRVQQAFVTFLTEAQARNAVEVINTNQEKYFPIRARPNKIDNNSNAGSTTPRSRSATRPRRVSFSTRDIMVEIDTTRPPSAGKPRELDLGSTEEQRKWAAHDLLLKQYKGEIEPPNRLEKILEVLRNSLDSEHMLEQCMNRERFHIYLGLAEAALEHGKLMISQLPADTLQAAYDLGFSTKRTTQEKVHAIRQKLYYDHVGRYPRKVLENLFETLFEQLDMQALLALCVDEEQFRLTVFHAKVAIEKKTHFVMPSLSIAVEELIVRLNLDRLDNLTEWKQALCGEVPNMYQDFYCGEDLREVVNMLFQSPLLPDDVYRLLDLCVNADQFRLMMFHAKVTLEARSELVQSSLSEEEKKLVLDLNLDKIDTIAQWGQAITGHLLSKYQDSYGKARLEPILNKVVDTTSSAYNLLGLCVNERQFRLSVFKAKVALADGTEFRDPCFVEHYPIQNLFVHRHLELEHPPLSFAMEELVLKLDLDRIETVEEWLQSLQKHLIDSYLERYGKERIEKIADTMLCNVQSVPAFFGVLKICTMDLDLFSVYALAAEITVKNRIIFIYESLTDDSDILVRDLGLSQLNSLEEWLETLRKYMLRTYQRRYGVRWLDMMLDAMFEYVYEPKDLYSLLKTCASSDRVDFYGAIAMVLLEEKVEKGDYKTLYKSLLNGVLELYHTLKLNKTFILSEWKDKLFGYLQREHVEIYGEKRLGTILDKLSKDFNPLRDLFQLLECCADERRFHIYAMAAEIAIEEKGPLNFCHIPEDLAAEVKWRNLDKLPTFAPIKDALTKNLRYKYDWDYAPPEHLANTLGLSYSLCELLEECTKDPEEEEDLRDDIFYDPYDNPFGF